MTSVDRMRDPIALDGTGEVPAVAPGVLELHHEFLTALPELCLRWQASAVSDPQLVVLNHSLVEQLGLDPAALTSGEGVGVFSGNLVPEGSVPVALAYAGHQFGNYSPRLGDGRALLLGELERPDGALVDVHLKGSGRTPFARGGDGKATIGPMLREFIISESMHRMGVPTTRSLAVVTTGESVYRDGFEPGAVLTRIAASHIRVGTFEYAVRLGGSDLVRRLADHSIIRHHSGAAEDGNPYRALLASVVDAQALLLAKWMTLGFIHGVMNTDNMSISGEGIDYGPCAFMDRYDPATVFSSIDHGGRYAYGNQVRVAVWNLARFAETLLDLLSPDPDEAVEMATEMVNGFVDRFGVHWRQEMARKLGFEEWSSVDSTLFDDLLTVMQADRLDWTSTYRHLAENLGSGATPADDTSDEFRAWVSRWWAELKQHGRSVEDASNQMDSVNPVYIPRNHLVQEALDAATAGDLSSFGELLDVLSDPFTRCPGLDRYAEPAPEGFDDSFRTFCGT